MLFFEVFANPSQRTSLSNAVSCSQWLESLSTPRAKSDPPVYAFRVAVRDYSLHGITWEDLTALNVVDAISLMPRHPPSFVTGRVRHRAPYQEVRTTRRMRGQPLCCRVVAVRMEDATSEPLPTTAAWFTCIGDALVRSVGAFRAQDAAPFRSGEEEGR